MKKSLLLWGALVIVALCFVGCCYYNTTSNHHCAKCCKHTPCCAQSGKTCPDSKNAADTGDDSEVETVTVMVTAPQAKPVRTFWDDVTWFFSGLFA